MTARKLGELKAAVVVHDFELETDIDTELTNWINDGYLEIAKQDLPCFLKKGTINTTIGENEYALPDDFRLMNTMYLEDEDGGVIDFHYSDSLFYYDNYNVENHTSENYAKSFSAVIHSETLGIKFNCKFDKVYKIVYYYYHVPTRMTDDLTHYPVIPALYDNLLVVYAQAQYRKRERDFEGYNTEISKFNSDLLDWVLKSSKKIKSQHDFMNDIRSYYRKNGGIMT